MFIFKYFRKSFNYKEILKQEENSLFKMFVFFLLMILIANFPLTYNAYKNKGSKIDFIIADFSQEVPSWDLPTEFEIKGGKLQNNGNDNTYTYYYKDIKYVINNKEKVNVEENKNSIILNELSIIYIDDKGNTLEGFNYKGFEDEFSFLELSLATNEEKINLYQKLAYGIEKSFSNEIILFTILRDNIVQIFINTLYVLILSLLVQLFRYGYQNFMSYKNGLKFVLNSMSVPAILSLIFGLLSPPFGPVVFQLSSGMIVMIIMLVFGKKTLA